MGWLELLPLLKRVLPLLLRVAPALEAFVSAKAGSGGGQLSLDRISSELNTAAGLHHEEMRAALAAQDDRLAAVAADIKARATQQASRLTALEQETAVLRSTLRWAFAGVIFLLLVCIGLLLALLLHHQA